ncbi:hypothetical protein BgiMline_001002 [Biomphalaria glabrata]|uniref:Uncharacterized protein LOC106060576 n=1 Tax=Biomphalaria glabrata TaxID=6526 RepID=A0A2C9M7V8_BIOGL|nr:uncharacterized protein LOC106060576 [Biomphalaria glabrata]KAI8768905.1 hypothetical protein BgiMline_000928 [Biomphalaria glabrata]KAI8789135.1 hypothetical protein BgiBS90_009393 [Biomphalaria glabrata]
MLRLGKFSFYVLLFLSGILANSLIYNIFQVLNKSKSERILRQNLNYWQQEEAVESKDAFVERMASVLTQKLAAVTDSEKTENFVSCINEEVIGNSCASTGCLRLQLPTSVRERVNQLVRPYHLHLSDNITTVLREMRAQVPGTYEIIVVTATSSNHFEEAKSMISNVRVNLLPHLNNFTFIVYNLGLTEDEALQLSRNCNCLLIRFPFEKCPPHVSYLKCYTWKPIIVNAHITQTHWLLWADASIRFHQDFKHTADLLERARTRGLQVGWSPNSIAYQTLQSTFHFFGDEACAYQPYMSSLNAVIVFYNEEFVRRLILEPWSACAMSSQCMCPADEQDLQAIRISCHKRKGKYDYGICHRFDQSALSIIGTKLYQGLVGHIFLQDLRNFVDVRRGDKVIEKGAPFDTNELSKLL